VTVLELRGAAAARPNVLVARARFSGSAERGRRRRRLLELITAAGWVAPAKLAGPLDVARTGWHLWSTAHSSRSLGVTPRVLWGLAIGVPIGCSWPPWPACPHR